MSKDIKSEKTKNGKAWKKALKTAFTKGEKVDVTELSDKEKEYWKKLNKQDKKSKATNPTLAEKFKAWKEQVIANSTALADRIIDKAIDKEEKAKEWAKRKEEIAKTASHNKAVKANAKRDRKKAKILKLASTIPFVHIGKQAKKEDIEKYNNYLAVNRKIQVNAELDIARAHAAKMMNIETKANWKAKRKEIREREQKKAAIRKAHGRSAVTEKINAKRTTKEQRIEAKKAEKQQAYANYVKEQQRIASEKTADPKGAETRAEKRRTEAERLQMIAETRAERINRLIKESVKQKAKAKQDLLRFVESEKLRKARKEQKRATYLTKGAVETPKVKNKVEVRPSEIASMVPGSTKRYIIRIATEDKPDIVSDSANAFTGLPKELDKYMKKIHESHKKDANYVGVYAYSGIANNQVCVAEMINDKFREKYGDTISRMRGAKDKAA